MNQVVKFSFLMIILISGLSLSAQKKVKSPAKEMSESFNNVDVTINYNAPSVRDREIWGGLVPHDKVWRTGANGATKITLSADTQIEGQALAAGTYAIFTIPKENSWTIIFNKDADQWGANNYDEAKDALRVEVTPVMMDEKTEQLTFLKADDSSIHLTWDKMAVPIRIGAAL